MATPTDPLYSQQWHFGLLGDIQTIWDEYTGAGVTVVVYDDGVEYTHADLNDNYDASMHFAYDTNGDSIDEVFDPTPINSTDAHGTACAGIIGAEEGNGIGGTGVAWGVTLTGVNLLEDIQFGIAGVGGFGIDTVQELNFYIAALEHAQNFDIMSNSWGQTPLYGSWQNLSVSYDTAAFETVVDNGRGGLGTIVVQAAGNETLNMNGSALTITRHAITVAATYSNGFVADYSNWGVGLLVAAPASAVTTDLEGTDGYDSGDYTTTFGGTSAATPTVAGVVALMLEAEEGLGWRDVQNILAITAAQTGSTIGSGAGANEVSTWGTTTSDGGSSWNGGGLTFHVSYGFGMVDAFAAVRMAESWFLMNDAAQTSTNEQMVSFDYSGTPIVIPATFSGTEFTATSGFTVTQNIVIESIYLTVTIDHTWSTDLSFGLIAPDGTIVPVFFGEVGFDDATQTVDVTFMDGGWTWTFHITALLGFDSAGYWEFFVTDNYSLADGGQVTDFQVEFFGATSSNDDIHIVSRDFLELTAFDSTRSELTDTNGGTDWLNFVGVNSDGIGNGDVIIDMGSGGAFSVDGVAWGTLQAGGAVFENIITGDGNDQITGNGLNNEIHGMRGNDSIFGGSGDDSLFGGVGDDTLVGGLGADSFNGGAGHDIVDYGASTTAVRVLLGAAGTQGESNGDTYAGIEEVIGSGFNDSIFGTIANETLRGGAGADTLIGAGGTDSLFGGTEDDVLLGGVGADSLFGGSGNDTASYFNAASGVSVSLASTAGATGDAAGDAFDSIENILGSQHDDMIEGDGNGNTLSGAGGQDTIYGGLGDDSLAGQQGNDHLIGGSGADFLNGGAGIDTVDFSASVDAVQARIGGVNTGGDAAGDTLYGVENIIGTGQGDFLVGSNLANSIVGGDGGDSIYGATNADSLFGGQGDDTLTGGLGADFIDGGDGDRDMASFASSTIGVWIDLEAGTASLGEASGDTLVNIEWLVGSAFDDRLTGDTKDNRLAGGDGADRLNGGAGNDILVGGTDANQDLFIFNDLSTSGSDVITDFQDGIDILDVRGNGLSFADVNLQQVGGNVIVTFNGFTGSIQLNGLNTSDIAADDFFF